MKSVMNMILFTNTREVLDLPVVQTAHTLLVNLPHLSLFFMWYVNAFSVFGTACLIKEMLI